MSHGRPNDIHTIKTLNKAGCTIPTYILIDNTDKKADEYIKKFGDKLIIFDKKKYIDSTENYDSFENYGVIIYARNACFDVAENLVTNIF